ncbi:AB hydrolase-1 domain-containing protein [Mycena kentingensis (nom. inval.)]|nr:AB hydrolase-1 domain-containing protein [Mycena kentingensis (nom. inval.)]
MNFYETFVLVEQGLRTLQRGRSTKKPNFFFAMPNVSIHSAGGPLDIAYTIATPTSPSAKAITPGLPTLLLLHSMCLGQMSFHKQFTDARLRRFNLVTLDLRSHGATIGAVKDSYGVAEAVDDVDKFIDAISLPSELHLVGTNIGALIAIELAALRGKRFASLTLISPAPIAEPAHVADGRREIYECWSAAFSDTPDPSAVLDAVCGAMQLGCNGQTNSYIKALVAQTLEVGERNWTPPNLEAYNRAIVTFFTDRSPPTLRGIACPVLLVQAGEDVAYKLAGTESLRDAMRANGVSSVRIEVIPGAPQWAHVTDPEAVNKLIHDHVMDCHADADIPPAFKGQPVSPFAAPLAKAGYRPGRRGDDSDDSDDESD